MVETPRYAGAHMLFFSWFRYRSFLKSTLSELLFGNGLVATDTRIRRDNFSVVEHVHSIKLVAKERRPNGFLESR